MKLHEPFRFPLSSETFTHRVLFWFVVAPLLIILVIGSAPIIFFWYLREKISRALLRVYAVRTKKRIFLSYSTNPSWNAMLDAELRAIVSTRGVLLLTSGSKHRVLGYLARHASSKRAPFILLIEPGKTMKSLNLEKALTKASKGNSVMLQNLKAKLTAINTFPN